MDEFLDWGGKILLAGGLGAVLGVEREMRARWAGVRTQSLVAMGAALLAGVGLELQGAGVDQSRIASQVVTGVGFIGAGVILKNGVNVVGLTTAATLWVSAGLGVAVGLGEWQAAVVTTVLAVFVVLVLRWIKPILPSPDRIRIEADYEAGHGTIGPLLRGLEDLQIPAEDVHVDDEAVEGVRRVTIELTTSDRDQLEILLERLRDRPEVRQIRTKE